MKKFLSILLLMLPLGGTAISQTVDPEPTPYEGLSPFVIQWELAPRFLFTDREELSGLTFFDRSYVCPPKEVMEKWVAAAAKKVERTYVPELHDCDDLAWEMLVFLRREAVKAHEPKLRHAIIAGMAYVSITQPIKELGTDIIGDHALVLVRVKGGGWWLIEPGNGKGVKLDEPLFEGSLKFNGAWF